MEKTYIFGHRKPDTDSVCSAISLSYLKKQLGESTEARILGNINKETAYALDYFGVKIPKYLNDVKLQLKDVDYHKHYFLDEFKSIYDSYLYMLNQGLTGVPVVDSKEKLLGIVTIKDLAHHFISDKINLLRTSYKNLLEVLKAEEVLKFDDNFSSDKELYPQ